MGRYIRRPPFLGTEDLICIYQMRGKYYHRRRSNLTAERVKTDPRFKRTMEFAGLMARASRIGSKVYHALPADVKRHPLYRKITGEALQWLQYQWEDASIIDYLQEKYKTIPVFTILTKADKPAASRTKWDPADWQPLTHRRSIKAFVRNMCDRKPARKNRQYDRFLATEACSEGDTT